MGAGFASMPNSNSDAVITKRQQLFQLLTAAAGSHSGVEDRFVWQHNSNGEFTIASTTSLLHNSTLNAWPPLTVTLLKVVWNMPIPPKIKIFMWTFFTNRLPVKVSFLEKCVNLNSSNPVCVFCSSNPEDLEHFFSNVVLLIICGSGFSSGWGKLSLSHCRSSLILPWFRRK